MRNLLIVIFMIGLLITQISCEPDDNFDESNLELPLISDNGSNTFGCQIDSTNWVPYDYDSNEKSPLNIQFQLPNQFLFNFKFRSKKFNRDENFTLLFKADSIEIVDPELFLFSDYNNEDGCTGYVTDQKIDNHFTISKCDFVNKIISGTFEMSLQNLCGKYKNLSITNGRFDIAF